MATSSSLRPCLAPMKSRRILTLASVTAVCAVAVFSLCWLRAAGGQQPAAAPTAGTGSISGHIYREDGVTPAVGTVISLLATPVKGAPVWPDALYLQTVRTGLDGAYKFSSVEPGAHVVHVIKGNGFSPREPSQTVSLAAGQNVENIDFRLPPTENRTAVAPGQSVQGTDGQTGAISGNVRDQNNAPIEGIFVVAMCGRPDVFGMTDADGNFRVQALAPGDCRVQARTSSGGPTSQVGYHHVYYPSAETIDKAQIVSVTAGAEITNINLTVPYSTTYRIHVTVLDDGQGRDNGYVILNGGAPPTFAAPDGTAELRGFLPGTYTISVRRATVTGGPNGQRRAAPSGQSIGSAIVQVVDGDVNVEIPISDFPANAR